jgi:hypothetical protein
LWEVAEPSVPGEEGWEWGGVLLVECSVRVGVCVYVGVCVNVVPSGVLAGGVPAGWGACIVQDFCITPNITPLLPYSPTPLTSLLYLSLAVPPQCCSHLSHVLGP